MMMGTSMHYGARKEIFLFAKFLRKNLTAAEKLLWENLCKKQIGYKFRPQHPTWRYVTDFYCHELRLVIEVDGSIHLLDEIRQNDRDRENILCSFGLEILRFTNEEVMDNLDFIMDTIENRTCEIKSRLLLGHAFHSEEMLNTIVKKLDTISKESVLLSDIKSTLESP